MLIRLAAPANTVSGKHGNDMVYFPWRGLQCARDYTLPTNPNTQPQNAVRTVLSELAKNYRTLPAHVRAAWENYGRQYPVQTRLNLSVSAPGIAKYVECNALAVLCGRPRRDNAPTTAPPSPISEIIEMNLEPNSASIIVGHTPQPGGSLIVIYGFKAPSTAWTVSTARLRPLSFPYSFCSGSPTAGSTQTTVTATKLRTPMAQSECWHLGGVIVSPENVPSRRHAQVVMT